MGYGGKVAKQQRARELRAQAWTLREIAAELGVAKSSVSRWVRNVDFEPRPHNRTRRTGPHPLTLRKEQELERCRREAEATIGSLDAAGLRMFALGLYAGEGAKTDAGSVSMANTNPILLLIFLTWARREFEIDEARLRARLYLHSDLDLAQAESFWSEALSIPLAQFTRPYRAAADPTRRRSKHVHGCATVVYSCTTTYRRVMAMIAAVASQFADPG